jgi:hypothetical protein
MQMCTIHDTVMKRADHWMHFHLVDPPGTDELHCTSHMDTVYLAQQRGFCCIIGVQVATPGPDPQQDSRLASEGFLRLRSRPTTNFVGDLMAEGAVDLVMAELDGSWTEAGLAGSGSRVPLLPASLTSASEAGRGKLQQQDGVDMAQRCFLRAQKQLIKQRSSVSPRLEDGQAACPADEPGPQ